MSSRRDSLRSRLGLPAREAGPGPEIGVPLPVVTFPKGMRLYHGTSAKAAWEYASPPRPLTFFHTRLEKYAPGSGYDRVVVYELSEDLPRILDVARSSGRGGSSDLPFDAWDLCTEGYDGAYDELHGDQVLICAVSALRRIEVLSLR